MILTIVKLCKRLRVPKNDAWTVIFRSADPGWQTTHVIW